MSLLTAAAAWHLGQLHAMEKVLVGVIAFGPFVVLAVVVYVVRKRDLAAEEAERPVAQGEAQREDQQEDRQEEVQGD